MNKRIGQVHLARLRAGTHRHAARRREGGDRFERRHDGGIGRGDAGVAQLLALAAGRFVEHLLFDVTMADPLVHAIVAIVSAGAGLLAAAGPAWRATTIDPATALEAA